MWETSDKVRTITSIVIIIMMALMMQVLTGMETDVEVNTTSGEPGEGAVDTAIVVVFEVNVTSEEAWVITEDIPIPEGWYRQWLPAETLTLFIDTPDGTAHYYIEALQRHDEVQRVIVI